MKSKEVVKEVMKIRGHTNQSLSEKLNYPHASGVSQRLRGEGDMNVSVLVKFLKAMDCELIIRSTLIDKTQWTVTDTDEPKIDLNDLLSTEDEPTPPSKKIGRIKLTNKRNEPNR